MRLGAADNSVCRTYEDDETEHKGRYLKKLTSWTKHDIKIPTGHRYMKSPLICNRASYLELMNE